MSNDLRDAAVCPEPAPVRDGSMLGQDGTTPARRVLHTASDFSAAPEPPAALLLLALDAAAMRAALTEGPDTEVDTIRMPVGGMALDFDDVNR